MSGYAIRRILLIPPTLLIVMLMVFSMVALLPGDAVDAAGGRGLSSGSPEAREAKRAALGLDRPLPVQLVAWLVGWPRTEGVVLQSLDAGLTWAPVDESAIHFFNDMAFPTAKRGVAVDKSGEIFTTTDAGVSWLKKLDENETTLNGVAFSGPTDGVAVGNDGVMFLTTNSGDAWTAISSGTGTVLHDIAFSGQNGWAVGDGGTLVATTDGGRTWSARQAGTTSALRSVAANAADPMTATAMGDGGTILRTTDGGTTWTAVASPVTTGLNATTMFDATRGWAVGAGGVILATTDGGATWSALNSGSTVDLDSVSFGTETTGVAAGQGGVMLRTADGGATWTLQVLNEARPITKDITSVAFVAQQTAYASGWHADFKWGLLGGNLGTSLLTSRTAAHELGNRIPRSLQLMVMAMILAVGIGIPVGVFAAIRQDTWIDYIARTIAVFGLSLPSFWFATLVILLPAVWFSWTPPLEYVSFWDDPVANMQFFALPAIVVGFGTMAAIMRMTRATMLETMRQDYIRTAWSKGLRESSVVIRHALKNAMIPVITIIGIQIPFILGETVVIEYIFRSPGIGLLAWDSVTRRDYPMLQAVVLFLAFMYIVMNLVVDLLYGWLDPRIRYA